MILECRVHTASQPFRVICTTPQSGNVSIHRNYDHPFSAVPAPLCDTLSKRLVGLRTSLDCGRFCRGRLPAPDSLRHSSASIGSDYIRLHVRLDVVPIPLSNQELLDSSHFSDVKQRDRGSRPWPNSPICRRKSCSRSFRPYGFQISTRLGLLASILMR